MPKSIMNSQLQSCMSLLSIRNIIVEKIFNVVIMPFKKKNTVDIVLNNYI